MQTEHDVSDLLAYAFHLLRRRMAANARMSHDELKSEAGEVVATAMLKHDPTRGTLKAIVFHVARTRAFSINRSGTRSRILYVHDDFLKSIPERASTYARA